MRLRYPLRYPLQVYLPCSVILDLFSAALHTPPHNLLPPPLAVSPQAATCSTPMSSRPAAPGGRPPLRGLQGRASPPTSSSPTPGIRWGQAVLLCRVVVCEIHLPPLIGRCILCWQVVVPTGAAVLHLPLRRLCCTAFRASILLGWPSAWRTPSEAPGKAQLRRQHDELQAQCTWQLLASLRRATTCSALSSRWQGRLCFTSRLMPGCRCHCFPTGGQSASRELDIEQMRAGHRTQCAQQGGGGASDPVPCWADE